MKWFAVLLMLALPQAADAANGATCTITPPSTADNASTVNNTVASCIDVCDYTSLNGALTCGPVYLPIQNAASTTFQILATVANCSFDSVDVVAVDSSTAPTGEHLKVYGTMDDDSGCGSAGTSQCMGVDIPYPISGWVYIWSNNLTVGGAGCTSFKVRMKQSAVRTWK